MKVIIILEHPFNREVFFLKALDLQVLCIGMSLHIKVGDSNMQIVVKEVHEFLSDGIISAFCRPYDTSYGENESLANRLSDIFLSDTTWIEFGRGYYDTTKPDYFDVYDVASLRAVLERS